MKSEEYFKQIITKWLVFINFCMLIISCGVLIINSFVMFNKYLASDINNKFVFKFVFISLINFLLSLISYLVLLKSKKESTKLTCSINLLIICSTPCLFYPKYLIFSLIPSFAIILSSALEEYKVLVIYYFLNILLIGYSYIISQDLLMAMICLLIVTLVFIISRQFNRLFIDITDFIDKIYVNQLVLEKKLNIDPLTKILNKRALENDLKEIINNLDHQKQLPCVTMIDLDFFKAVNDTYGHLNGDKTLKTLAKTFTKHLDENMAVYRFGGEEFVIVIENKTIDEVFAIIEKIRKDFGSIKHKYLKNKTVTLSAGISLYENKDTIDEWIAKADKALYEAKNQGRNRTIVHEGEK